MTARDLPDILCVSMDTMRRDCMAPYGKDLLPAATRLLERGSAFSRCVAPAPWTGASFGSALTGLWPREHGCLSPKPSANRPRLFAPLKAGVRFLPEIFKEAGYHTISSQGNAGWLGPGFGFTRGFDVHNVGYLDGGLGKPRRIAAGLTEGGILRFGAYVLRRAIRRLRLDRLPRRNPLHTAGALVQFVPRRVGRAPTDRPVFAWVNFIDMHDPYWAPQKWMPRREAPGRVRPVHMQPHWYLEDTLTEADKAYMRRRYENTSCYANSCLEALLANWPELRPKRPRLTVFFSDHGEEFWDHGDDRSDPFFYRRGVQHGHTLYSDQLRVPLIFHWPQGGLAPGRVDALVGLIDLAPTLVELLALEEDVGSMAGRSLAPYLTAGESAVSDERLVFADSLLWGPERQAALSATHKLIRCPETGETELYAWGAEDPAEKVNLADSAGHATLRERLDKALDGWNARLSVAEQSRPPEEPYTDEDQSEIEARLRELGYL